MYVTTRVFSPGGALVVGEAGMVLVGAVLWSWSWSWSWSGVSSMKSVGLSCYKRRATNRSVLRREPTIPTWAWAYRILTFTLPRLRSGEVSYRTSHLYPKARRPVDLKADPDRGRDQRQGSAQVTQNRGSRPHRVSIWVEREVPDSYNASRWRSARQSRPRGSLLEYGSDNLPRLVRTSRDAGSEGLVTAECAWQTRCI